MGSEPGPATFQIGTNAQRVHAPADATRMLERARNQLIERVHEQLALPDRREERERGDDRLRLDAPLDRLGDTSRGETPQLLSHGAELRGHRRFGKRGERAEGANAELAEPAVRAHIEWQDCDWLGSEKIPFSSNWHYDRFARLCAAGRDPSGEIFSSPTQSDGLTVGRPDGETN